MTSSIGQRTNIPSVCDIMVMLEHPYRCYVHLGIGMTFFYAFGKA